MGRRTVMPDSYGCTDESAEKEGFWPFNRNKGRRMHKWQYSPAWNGNSKKVLPFETRTSGIARSGWRCFHCGKFVWDQTDEQFAVMQAMYAGALPNFADLMQGADIQYRPQRTDTFERLVEISKDRKEISNAA